MIKCGIKLSQVLCNRMKTCQAHKGNKNRQDFKFYYLYSAKQPLIYLPNKINKAKSASNLVTKFVEARKTVKKITFKTV